MKSMICFFVGLVLVSHSVWALTSAEIETAIQNMLEERHPSDTPEWWKALGPQAPAVIMQMYGKTTRIQYQIKLVQALAYYDDSAGAEFLKQQADSTQNDLIRGNALKSLGTSQGSKEEDQISKYLSHSDPSTRLAAAQALQSVGDARSKEILDKYMKEEKAAWVVTRLKSQLPQPPRSLKLASSTENNLHSDFGGQWKGFLVVAETGSSQEIHTETAVLKLKVENGTELKGELVLKHKNRFRTLMIGNAKGRGNQAKGSLMDQTRVQNAPDPAPIGFSAELTTQSGVTLLQIKVPEIAGTLVVRRISQ